MPGPAMKKKWKKTPAVGGEAKKEFTSKQKKDRTKRKKRKKSRDRLVATTIYYPASSPGPAVGGSPGSILKKSAHAVGGAGSRTSAAAVDGATGSGNKKVKVLQPLSELLPAQAATELVQPDSIQPLAELQHVLMRRRWTRIRTRRIPLQKTSAQPLAELQHQ